MFPGKRQAPRSTGTRMALAEPRAEVERIRATVPSFGEQRGLERLPDDA